MVRTTDPTLRPSEGRVAHRFSGGGAEDGPHNGPYAPPLRGTGGPSLYRWGSRRWSARRTLRFASPRRVEGIHGQDKRGYFPQRPLFSKWVILSTRR